MKTLRVLIVDDEPLARDVIRHCLAGKPGVEIAAESGSVREAVAALRNTAVDLIFLDVQMPGQDGFALLEKLPVDSPPAVVFVTAHDRYAVRAFESQALDYLLKPFDPLRFDRAFVRARRAIEHARAGELAGKLQALLAAVRTEPSGNAAAAVARQNARLMVREGGKIVFVRADELQWLEADGDYVRLKTASRRHLVHETLGKLETQLDPGRFVRIHRSVIVNLEQVREMEPYFNGEYHLLMQDGSRLKSSRTYRDRLLAALGKPVS